MTVAGAKRNEVSSRVAVHSGEEWRNGLIRKAAEQRANRLTHAEFEREATWATRKFVPFVMQRISVAVQIAAATEIRQALGRGMGPDSA